MKKQIQSSIKDIEEIKEEDVVAMTFSSLTAMGVAGEITIITAKNHKIQQHKFQYGKNQKIKELLYERFPALKEQINGWSEINMGFGNWLIIRETLKTKFENRLREINKHIYPSYLSVLNDVISGIPCGESDKKA